jgi:hypothetical protein
VLAATGIHEVLADHRILVSDGIAALLCDRASCLAQFKRQGILVYLFEEPERVVRVCLRIQ